MSFKKNLSICVFFMAVTAMPGFGIPEKPDTASASSELSLADLLNVSVEGISKEKESYRDVPMCVYVVGKDELDRWGIRNFYDVFQRVPGYAYYNSDTYGSYGPIGRGLTSVFRFGVSMELMNMVDFGHYQLTPHFFKNVEVARGPAGLMWGTSALAGLINFNLRDDLNGAEVYTELGDYNRYAQDVLFGNSFKDADPGDGYFVGWRYQREDPEVKDSALKDMGQQSIDYKYEGFNPSQALIGKIKYKGAKFMAYYDHTRFVAPVMWMGNFRDWSRSNYVTDTLIAHQGQNFGDEMEVLMTRMEYTLPFQTYIDKKFPLILSLYHESYWKQWVFPGLAQGDQRKETYGFRGQMGFLNEALNFNFGGDLWGQNLSSAPSWTSAYAHDTLGWNFFDNIWQYPSTTYENLYCQGSYKFLEKFTVLLGGRIDHKETGKYDIIASGPRVGVFYSPTDNVTFKYLYNSSSRPPEGNEANSESVWGQSLNPEKLSAHEFVSTIALSNKLSLDLSFFYQQLTDAIVVDHDTAYSHAAFAKYINASGMRDRGVEWALKYFPTNFLMASWNGSVNDAKVIKDTITNQDGTPQIIADPYGVKDRPLFVPMMVNYLSVDCNVLNYVHINPALRFIYKIPYKQLNARDSTANALFLDLSLASPKFFHNRLDFSAAVLNLLDANKGVPAFGEHLGNPPGTVPPEGRRISIIAHLAL